MMKLAIKKLCRLWKKPTTSILLTTVKKDLALKVQKKIYTQVHSAPFVACTHAPRSAKKVHQAATYHKVHLCQIYGHTVCMSGRQNVGNVHNKESLYWRLQTSTQHQVWSWIYSLETFVNHVACPLFQLSRVLYCSSLFRHQKLFWFWVVSSLLMSMLCPVMKRRKSSSFWGVIT